MKKIILNLLFVVALFVCISSGSGIFAAATPDEIHYTFTGPTAITFDWRGDPTSIAYGPTTAYGTTVTAGAPSPMNPISSAGPWREARLTGLQPATTYHYSIGGSSDSTFKTPPMPGTAGFTVYAEGDIGSSLSYNNVRALQQLVAAGNPSFVLVVGDLTYGNSKSPQDVDQHFNDVMVWSKTAAYQPAWGNHEWDKSTDDLRNYKGRFDFANPQTDPKSPSVSCCGEDWYWFDYGNVRFIAYPEPWSGDNWSNWNTVVKGIMDNAQTDPNIRFIVTYGHRPAWSSGHHPGSNTLSGYMKALHASHSKYVLNVNGHSHNYERTNPAQTDGIVHITTGTGGSALENVNPSGCLWQSCPPPSWSAKRFMRFGVTKLEFSANGIQGSYICGPPGGGTNDVNCNLGDIIDTFSIGNPAQETPQLTQPAASPIPPQGTIPCQNIPTSVGVVQNLVNVPANGLYKIWTRMTGTSSEVNSYYLQVDDSCFLAGGVTLQTGVWTWTDFQSGSASNKLLMNLSAGNHTVKLIGKDAGFKIDVLLFTQDMVCNPGATNGCTGISVTPGAGCGVMGDTNGDGKVTLGDFEIWRRAFIRTTVGSNTCGLNGDANHDGKVTLADYEIWRRVFKAQ